MSGSKRDLREACVREALRIIEKKGVEELSLRQVARRLKVSHQAPYRHFPSRDHLLAEIIRRGFEKFSEFLNGRERSEDPMEDLRNLGIAYISFATKHPLYYRLMFATPHPSPAKHRHMHEKSLETFNILRESLGVVRGEAADSEQVEGDALFIWSCMHGISSILQSDVLGQLNLRPEHREKAAGHVLFRIRRALGGAEAGDDPQSYAGEVHRLQPDGENGA